MENNALNENSYPRPSGDPPPKSKEESDHVMNAYLQASIKEVVSEIYPLRFKTHQTTTIPIWEIDYQAAAFSHQFIETIEGLDALQARVWRARFIQGVIAEVRAKIERRELS
jgi:hypothetical protein